MQNLKLQLKLQNFKNGKGGFTLIEIILVVAILIIITMLILFSFRSLLTQTNLDNTSEEIMSILKLARSKTLASEGSAQYGVYFNDTTTPNQYTLFKGSDYVSRDNSFDNIYKLPSKIEICEINLGMGKEVVFNRIDGTTDQKGSVKIRLIADITKTDIVNINSSGWVYIGEEIICCQNGRHIHFDYNDDTQTAATLSLIFPDYAGDNFDISFQDYLNEGKTGFKWDGSIPVGPILNKTDQKLIIHTRSLTPAATQFCVHRLLPKDQIYNDKALNISIDGEELIKFSADGAATKGSSLKVGDFEYN